MTGRRMVRRLGLLAVGGLAVVMAAPAFACTGSGARLVFTPSEVPQGTPIDIRGEKFQAPQDGGGNVTLRWGGPNATVIATRTPNSVGVIEVKGVPMPAWVTVKAGDPSRPEQLTAYQMVKDEQGRYKEASTESYLTVTAVQSAPTTAPSPTAPPTTPKPAPLPPGTPPGTAPVPIGAANLAEAPSRDAAGSERAAPAGTDPLGPGHLPVLVGPGAEDPLTVPAGSVVPPPVLPDARSLWSGLDPAPGTGLLEAAPSQSERPGPSGLLLLGGGGLLFATAAVTGLRRRSAVRVLART